MTRTRGLLLCACAVLACAAAGGARAGLDVGVTEDAGKTGDGGATFFATLNCSRRASSLSSATLNDVGLKVNRVSINWDAANPTIIGGQDEIASWMPQAQAAGTRIIFAVSPLRAADLTATSDAKTKFAATSGKPLAAAQFLPVLASSYDALKAVDPTINVIGVGLSPRGNDNPFGKSNVSRSPVRFLHDLGVAYRASGRTKPLMDELAYHPYPQPQQGPPSVRYAWPTAGLANLDRIKQAVWDAFNGTAQPTFPESGKSLFKPLKFDLDEVGWQVAPLPALASLYTGVETPGTRLISEDDQAAYYRDTVMLAECDPGVRMLSFFHLVDETDLDRWQSGLERADGSHRPSYDAVKQLLAQSHGNCQTTPVKWRHVTAVVLPAVAWGSLKPQPLKRTRWSFTAGAGEEADFRAGLFKAGPSKAVLGKHLAAGKPKPLLPARGVIKASTRLVSFPTRRLKPGLYVYAIRMTATMNSKRASVLVSRPFRVGTRKK